MTVKLPINIASQLNSNVDELCRIFEPFISKDQIIAIAALNENHSCYKTGRKAFYFVVFYYITFYSQSINKITDLTTNGVRSHIDEFFKPFGGEEFTSDKEYTDSFYTCFGVVYLTNWTNCLSMLELYYGSSQKNTIERDQFGILGDVFAELIFNLYSPGFGNNQLNSLDLCPLEKTVAEIYNIAEGSKKCNANILEKHLVFRSILVDFVYHNEIHNFWKIFSAVYRRY